MEDQGTNHDSTPMPSLQATPSVYAHALSIYVMCLAHTICPGCTIHASWSRLCPASPQPCRLSLPMPPSGLAPAQATPCPSIPRLRPPTWSLSPCPCLTESCSNCRNFVPWPSSICWYRHLHLRPHLHVSSSMSGPTSCIQVGLSTPHLH